MTLFFNLIRAVHQRFRVAIAARYPRFDRMRGLMLLPSCHIAAHASALARSLGVGISISE
jgi:hypothetical protein